MSDKATVVRLDSRGRVNLKPFKPQSDTFHLYVDADGTIRMEPLVQMTLKERQALERQLLERDAAEVKAAEEPASPDAGVGE